MSRNDVHSPKNLVTEDYEYIFAEVNHIDGAPGWVLRNGDYGLEMSRRIAATDRLGRSTHQCHHCGARLNYFAVLEHTPTGDLIVVGETCLDNRFDRATADFHRLRKQAQLDRQKQRIRKAVAEFAEQNPDLAFLANRDPEVYEAQAPEHSKENWWLQELSRKLNQYGSLFPNQIESARKSIVKDAEIAARKAAEALEPQVDVIEGRITIEGEVLSTKWQEGYMGGEVLKMLVKDARGFKVWGSVPAHLQAERGCVVRFDAQVERSQKDSTFGFFKRPTKATMIKEAEAT